MRIVNTSFFWPSSTAYAYKNMHTYMYIYVNKTMYQDMV